MCNACGLLCCGSDLLGGCGCSSCGEIECLDTCFICRGIIEWGDCTCDDDLDEEVAADA